uniref:Uncharacterized protein At1g32220ic isoform X2 n=1 Tax=Rhizophora mucronata TaxID=61149 RepID=A0A2P2KJX3_RHIMU
MGKEGELWDDSALLNAFDDAMSKYKKMHGKKKQDIAPDGGKVAGSAWETVSATNAPTDGTAIREAGENSKAVSNIMTEVGKSKSSATLEENHGSESIGPGPYIDPSNGTNVQSVDGYSYVQGAEDYNQLLNQYYELEEKRQSILQQLQQFGGYNYQGLENSGYGLQLGTSSTSQDYHVPANQASCSTVNCSYCCCACPCSVPSCTSACSMCTTHVSKTCTDSSVTVGPKESGALIDGDIVKTALGAAEKAISSMKMKTSVDAGVEGNTGQDKRKDSDEEMRQTDLSIVLNAWYSAGFYTGKYLTEQSITKK